MLRIPLVNGFSAIMRYLSQKLLDESKIIKIERKRNQMTQRFTQFSDFLQFL